MKYCENCRAITEEEICEVCGRTELREVREDDYCLLTECSEKFGKMLYFSLQDCDIKCAMVPFGNGARNALGLNLESFRMYVPYERYEEAKDVIAVLSVDPTENIRAKLLENQEEWHVNNPRMLKKLCRRLKLKDDTKLMETVKSMVEAMPRITDGGLISGCPEGGHYIFIKTDEGKFWFNSVTFEIFI